jgi:hypothetical protein
VVVLVEQKMLVVAHTLVALAEYALPCLVTALALHLEVAKYKKLMV